MTSAFKCDLCEEVKFEHAAAYGGMKPTEAKVETNHGQDVWQFTIFISRNGVVDGTAVFGGERDLHLCRGCALELLKKALTEKP